MQYRYVASSGTLLTAAASTQPFGVLYGSPTKIVRVQRIRLDGATLTGTEYLNIAFCRCSSQPSGGTYVDPTKLPVDTSSPVATASLVRYYTAAPTGGDIVGCLAATRVLGQSNNATGNSLPHVEILFDWVLQDGIILRGADEGVSVRFASQPGSAVTLNIDYEWTEE